VFEKEEGFAISLGLSGLHRPSLPLCPSSTYMVLAYGWRLSQFVHRPGQPGGEMSSWSLSVNQGRSGYLGVEPYAAATVNHREARGIMRRSIRGADLGLGER